MTISWLYCIWELVSAKRLLQKYRGERPAKIRKVMNVETKEVFNSVRLAAASDNGATANIYVACRNDKLTAYGYHWKFVD